jgi:nitrate reductase alpha subunit
VALEPLRLLSKGNEYFLKYLLGTHSNVMAEEGAAQVRPQDVAWHEEPPEGKLDLLLSADFRMTSTTLLSDIVLPAATWYEKYDLSSTNMHPFVHAFTPAIDPPWEAKSDFAMFHLIARELSRQAETHLGTRQDLVAVSDAARHSRRDGTAAWSRAGLEARRCPRRAGHNDAQLPGRRTRLHRHR